MLSEVESGVRNMYRTKEQMEESKMAKGGVSNASWHLRGKVKHVLNMPITPGAQLSTAVGDKIGTILAPDGGQTKTVEKGGQNILSCLSKSDPFKTSGCRWDEECLASDKTDCMASNIVYRIQCTKCPEQGQPHDGVGVGDDNDEGQPPGSDGDEGQPPRVYIGQSGRSLHSRMAEHLRGLRGKDKSCPLTKHVDLCHDGETEDAKFETDIIHRARTNLSRLILEAEEIQNHRQKEILLNSKSEFRGTKIVRLVADREIV